MPTHLKKFYSCNGFRINSEFLIETIKFSSQKGIISELIRNKDILNLFGTIYFDLSKNGFIYDEQRILRVTLTEDLIVKELIGMSALFNNIFTCLWFHKDNAAVCTGGFIFLDDPSNMYYVPEGPFYRSLTLHKRVYLANGKHFNDDPIKPSELQRAFDLYKKLENIFTNGQKIEAVGGLRYIPPSINNLDKKGLNKFQMAMVLLEQMRINGYCLMKVSIGVLILDCLFGLDDTNEVTQTIALRISKYMGRSGSDQLHIFKLVKVFYRVRSAIMHGSRISDDLQKTLRNKYGYNNDEEISIGFDSFLRSILNKIIDNDLDVFCGETTAVREYLDRKIFGIQ